MLENRFEPSTVSEFSMCLASGASQGSAKCSSTTSIKGHTAVRATRDRPWGRRPTPAPARRRSGCPETGSRRSRTRRRAAPGLVPRWPDRRCESQRSMPCVGTDTTSACIGSGRGTATSSASSATRSSALSERWTWSTRAEYVADVRCGPADSACGRAPATPTISPRSPRRSRLRPQPGRRLGPPPRCRTTGGCSAAGPRPALPRRRRLRARRRRARPPADGAAPPRSARAR